MVGVHAAHAAPGSHGGHLVGNPAADANAAAAGIDELWLQLQEVVQANLPAQPRQGGLQQGASRTPQHLLGRGRSARPRCPWSPCTCSPPGCPRPASAHASLPSLRYLSIGSCDSLRWWGWERIARRGGGRRIQSCMQQPLRDMMHDFTLIAGSPKVYAYR